MLKSNRKSGNSGKMIYMDYASATPIDEVVLKSMQKTAKEYFANAGSIHTMGVKTKNLLEDARKNVAQFFGAHADEIIFTSGATESNNLAIFGILNKEDTASIPHIITTNIEHASVLEVCKYLEKTKQAEVTFVEVEPSGIVDSRKIQKAMKVNTVLVSVMYANNEIGTIQPIREIAKEIRYFNKTNSKKVYFHTDATQAVNYLDINTERLGVDILSMNSAKIYGPKGAGVLYKRRSVLLSSVLKGGDQEFALRPGTENVVNAVAIYESLKLTEKIKIKESKRQEVLRDLFIKKLEEEGIQINGSLIDRLPNNINITVPNIPSDLLVIELSARGIEASAKSACKSGDGKASHVIQAISPSAKDTDGSVRFSIGRHTKKEDIVYTVKSLKEILSKLDKWYH